MSDTNIAIVASGGGMTCSYSAGCILGLVEKYKLTHPNIVIGSSGSAGTLAYYVSGQYISIRNIWDNLLATPKFIDPWKFPRIINIDYLIDEVFKKQDPLDTDKVYNSKIEFLIPLTNTQTGKVTYFSNKSKIDIFEALRATKAMPIIYGKDVKVDRESYCDTYLSSDVKLNIEKSIEMGADKIIVIDNLNFDPMIVYGLNIWLMSKSQMFKNNYYSEFERIKNITNSRIIFLRPAIKLKITTLNNNKKILCETVNQGYNDIVNNSQLKHFLSQK